MYAGDYNQSGPLQLVLAVLALPFGVTGASPLVLHAVGNGWCLDVRSRWPEAVSIAALIYLPFLSYGTLTLPSVVLALAATGLAVVAALRPAVWFGALNRSARERVWLSEV